jgi:UPF0716 family protein affecting phage T7 exclusion
MLLPAALLLLPPFFLLRLRLLLLLPPLLCTFKASLGRARSKSRELFTEGRHSGQVLWVGGCRSQAGGGEADKAGACTMSRQAGH